MHKKITNISVSFRGIKTRCRKEDLHVERIRRIYSDECETFTPSQDSP